MASEVWEDITSPFPNFNVAAVEAREWLGNFTPHL